MEGQQPFVTVVVVVSMESWFQSALYSGDEMSDIIFVPLSNRRKGVPLTQGLHPYLDTTCPTPPFHPPGEDDDVRSIQLPCRASAGYSTP
mmetsp:Transcript_21363/g.23955  ORF Transcript_21363/g.23955 Transcript_21363/m.23955 type:complete len:90 (-) Transcript_21363:154-423(-)